MEDKTSYNDAPKDSTDGSKDQLWINRISRREDALAKKTSEGHWERYIAEHGGDYSEVLAGTRIIPLNLIYAYVSTTIPDLYLQDPYFEFTPKQRTTIGSAKLKEMAVNDIWHRKKFKREVKKGIQDGLIIGHGWYKVGFNANLGNVEEFQDSTENANQDDYFFYRINWRHVIFNDEAIDPPYDCTWIGHKFYIPCESAKNNKSWNEKRKNLNSVRLVEGETKEEKAKYGNLVSEDGDQDYAELYEIWDKVNKKVLIVSKQRNVGILHERDWPYVKMQGFPFLFLNLSFVNDDPYGISDVGMGEAHVLEKTKIRNAFLEHLKRGNRMLITTPNNFSEEMKDAYRRGEDSALLEAEDPLKVVKLPYAEFQSDVFGLESRLDDDLSQIWGQRAVDRAGQARTQTRTKFELQSQNVGTTSRLMEKRNIIQDITEEAVEKLSSLLEQYATEPFYISLTGFDPAEIAGILSSRPSALNPNSVTSQYGFTITSDDIKGPVDVRIREGSAVPLDKQSKLQLLKEMAQLYLQIKSRPNGPFIGAVSKMIVEEAGLHELTDALVAEAQFEAKQMADAQEQQVQAQEVAAGQQSAELQLKAQDLATKQQKVESDASLELMHLIKEIQMQLADINQKVVSRDNE